MKKKSSKKRNIKDAGPRRAGSEETPLGDGDFEEQLLQLWGVHGNFLIMIVALVVVAVLAYQFSGYFARRNVEKIQTAYQKTENSADLVAFGSEYSSHPLGGFAYLQAAHQEYDQKQYQEAAEHYEKAAEILADTPYAGRAQLGYAMASLSNGQAGIARQTLETLAGDESKLNSTRAEAAYNLAVHHWEKEDFEAVIEQLDFIETLAKPGYWIWAIKADQLRDSIPELRVEEAEAEEEAETETAGL